MNFALLPVKDPTRAKHRLAGLLSAREREQLARLMFRQTLETLMAARGFDRVVVAAGDAQILAEAAAAGALALAEFTQSGHSDSADRAARQCMSLGAATVLLVPIDVPLMTAAEPESLLGAALALPEPRLVIVPSADGTGTNAMVRTPPDLIESRFGPGSFAAHTAQALAKKAALEIARPEGLVLDLDTPEDLARFLERAPTRSVRSECPVAEFLRRLGIPDRRASPSGRDSAAPALERATERGTT